MRLPELLIKQKLIVQLLWGEQKIEFFSEVVDKDNYVVFVTPYIHDGAPLELNIKQNKGIICNIFTDDPSNSQRISWKNVELTTVNKEGKILYQLETFNFNLVSQHDDRRLHERTVVLTNATVFDGQSEEGVNIIIYDISDIGISFYAPKTYMPKSTQLVVAFTASVDDKSFNARVEVHVVRTTTKAGNAFIGCKIMSANKDYLLFGFMKRLKDKNKNKTKEIDKK